MGGRGLGDLLRTRSPKPEQPKGAQNLPYIGPYRGADLGGQGLGDLPARPPKPRQLYRKGAVQDKSPALGAGKLTAGSADPIEKSKVY